MWRALQRTPSGFRAVKETGLHVVLGQGQLGAVAVAGFQIGPIQQVLVHPNGALKLTTATKQVAQSEVQFGGVGVVLNGFDEGVDGPVLLLVEQQVQAFEVGPWRVLTFAAQLTQVQP